MALSRALDQHDLLADSGLSSYVKLTLKMDGVIAELDYNEFMASNRTRGMKILGFVHNTNTSSSPPTPTAQIEEIEWEEEEEVEASLDPLDPCEADGTEEVKGDDDNAGLLKAPGLGATARFEKREAISADEEEDEKKQKRRGRKYKAKKKRKSKGKASNEFEVDVEEQDDDQDTEGEFPGPDTDGEKGGMPLTGETPVEVEMVQKTLDAEHEELDDPLKPLEQVQAKTSWNGSAAHIVKEAAHQVRKVDDVRFLEHPGVVVENDTKPVMCPAPVEQLAGGLAVSQDAGGNAEYVHFHQHFLDAATQSDGEDRLKRESGSVSLDQGNVILPPTILITSEPEHDADTYMPLKDIPEEEEIEEEGLGGHQPATHMAGSQPEGDTSSATHGHYFGSEGAASDPTPSVKDDYQIPPTPPMDSYEFDDPATTASDAKASHEILTPPHTPPLAAPIINPEAEEELEDTSTEATPKANRFRSNLEIELIPSPVHAETTSLGRQHLPNLLPVKLIFGSIAPVGEETASDQDVTGVSQSKDHVPVALEEVPLPTFAPVVPACCPAILEELQLPPRPTGSPVIPSDGSLHQLDHAWTLYYSSTSSSSSVNIGQPPLRAKYKGADEYSDGLFRIFTHSNLEDIFGSWKALRRKIATKKGRPIEDEECRSAPGMEGLGMPFMSEESSFHFFKDGVKPMWEDPMCARGGKIMMMGSLVQVRQVLLSSMPPSSFSSVFSSLSYATR